jgi:16S rRNA (uracil1498-N3)-methyltransferase
VVSQEKHEFAFYIPLLSSMLGSNKTLMISDETLVHRMMVVLRLSVGDNVIFFDRNTYINADIAAFMKKKQLSVVINSVHTTVALKPTIVFLLPMLKRDDWQTALYALTEMGVNDIQLIFTQKSLHQWSEDRDRERAERIIIAAAEQSKNFAYPQLHVPLFLEQALEKYDAIKSKLFFDPHGDSLFTVMNALHVQQPEQLLLCVGPEGDLTAQEKKMVQDCGFMLCALTPTIMRAVQAVSCAAGCIRSLLRNTVR